MDLLSFMKDHGTWIATIIAAIVAGLFGLIKKFGKGNTQKIKNVKDSYIQQAGESINNTINKTNQKDKDIK